jgi:hypothetical protein
VDGDWERRSSEIALIKDEGDTGWEKEILPDYSVL